tara:strand:- start:349 stop:603 length:255 start_codon:yes stop_codon:yes gene_type:complete
MKKATYIQLTIEEVEELMSRALANWDRDLMDTVQAWEKDPEFKRSQDTADWQPSNWLFYAQGDSLENHAYIIEDTIKEISTNDK